MGTVVIVVLCEGDVCGRQAQRFSQSKLHIFGKQFRTGKTIELTLRFFSNGTGCQNLKLFVKLLEFVKRLLKFFVPVFFGPPEKCLDYFRILDLKFSMLCLVDGICRRF